MKQTVGVIASAAGYNNITLRVFSNPNFESLRSYGSDSDSDDNGSLSQGPRTSAATLCISGGIHARKTGKVGIIADE